MGRNTPWVEKSPGLTFPPDLFTEGAKSGIHQAKTNASQNPAKSPGIWVDTKWVGCFWGDLGSLEAPEKCGLLSEPSLWWSFSYCIFWKNLKAIKEKVWHSKGTTGANVVGYSMLHFKRNTCKATPSNHVYVVGETCPFYHLKRRGLPVSPHSSGPEEYDLYITSRRKHALQCIYIYIIIFVYLSSSPVLYIRRIHIHICYIQRFII